MITASHNPKQDNGYKLYGENGCQIIPPIDTEISELILQNLKPWNDKVWDRNSSNELKETSCPDPSSQLLDDYYLDIFSSLSLKQSVKSKPFNVKVCYTAMHGVGLAFAERIVEILQLQRMVIVDSQAQPDPEFPTVPFPNPEEKVFLSFVEIFSQCLSLC